MIKTFFILLNLILFLTLNIAHALDFGSVSDTLINLLSGISQILDVIAWVSGAGFAISAIIKYKEHRVRPQSVPLSGPVTEMVIAIILISFPFIMNVTAKNQTGDRILKEQYSETSYPNMGLINDSYHAGSSSTNRSRNIV